MITNKKVKQVNVFAGSPWEVASIIGLLNAAYINVSIVDDGLKGIKLMVPCEHYTAAMRVIGERNN